jgi:hypothetical protein
MSYRTPTLADRSHISPVRRNPIRFPCLQASQTRIESMCVDARRIKIRQLRFDIGSITTNALNSFFLNVVYIKKPRNNELSTHRNAKTNHVRKKRTLRTY